MDNVVWGNNADNNTQYGINAAPGTIDGGGNTASGNGVQRTALTTCRALRELAVQESVIGAT